MDMQVRIGGMMVDRCTQDATVTLGVNFVTNRSNKKENDGAVATSGSLIFIPTQSIANLDEDLVDHPVFQMDNVIFGPF